MVTQERARRFARAYLDEFGPKGVFTMTMPSYEELDKVSKVFREELECSVTWSADRSSITVKLPWYSNTINA